MKNKTLLFSVTSKDFDIQTFCTGGPGGQHRNAKQNGVRIIHRASGAKAEHRDGRDQAKNKTAAFKKLLRTPEWLNWHRAEVARRSGAVDAAKKAAEEAMKANNLLVEVKDSNGRWKDERNLLTTSTVSANDDD